MSGTEDVQLWYDAVQLYDTGDINECIKTFLEVKRNARIMFDIGCCYLRINDVKTAIENYEVAVSLDCHLAIGYFMLGLTNYLLQRYDTAMTHFERTLDLLRGNRYVDYRQLGLKYQLYSCEVLTNQAVIAYTQNKIGKAKGLLLQAVGCTAGKKHERIVEALSLIQTGSSFPLFIPPQTEVFRPPKAAVDNLKKKNYLGKAKVISTENTEEIYACFSGIKEQMQGPQKTERPRPKPVDRVKMMTELRQPERKKTLRPTPRPPQKQLPDLGRVIDTPPKKGLPPRPPSTLPPTLLSPLPPRKLHDGNISEQSKLPPQRPSLPILTPIKPVTLSLPPRKPIPRPPDETDPEEEYQAVTSPDMMEEYDSLLSSSLASDSDGEMYEEIDDRHLQGKPRRSHTPVPFIPPRAQTHTSISPTPMKKNKDPSPPLPLRRDSTEDSSPNQRDRKQSNASLIKPERPPPAPPSKSSTRKVSVETQEKQSVIAPPRKCFPRQQSTPEMEVVKEMKTLLKSQTLPYSKDNKDLNHEDGAFQISSSPPNDATQVEIDVQYTFVKKVRLHNKMTLLEIKDAIRSESIPVGIELCFTDDLGRQQGLTDKTVISVFNGNKKLFCFPET